MWWNLTIAAVLVVDTQQTRSLCKAGVGSGDLACVETI